MTSLMDNPLFWKGASEEVKRVAENMEKKAQPMDPAMQAAPVSPEQQMQAAPPMDPAAAPVPAAPMPPADPMMDPGMADPMAGSTVIPVDISLLSRLMEWASLEVQNPTDLHIMTSRILQLAQSMAGTPLSAEDFEMLIGQGAPEQMAPPPEQAPPPPPEEGKKKSKKDEEKGEEESENQTGQNMEADNSGYQNEKTSEEGGFASRLIKAAQEHAKLNDWE